MATPGISTVDEIKERLDIAEVLSEYVKLVPAGPNRFKVLCPFHNEKTPSLMVSKDRQFWHCFGCSKGGDMFTFVQEIEGIDFPEALRLLAKKAHVEVRTADPQLQSVKTKLLEILRTAASFYRKVLTDAPYAAGARSYLEQRGVNAESSEEFQLGFSPTSWDALLTFLTKRGFQEQDIFDAGLVVRRERGSGHYDRFRGRIMFPIRDVNGTAVGFGGRMLETVEGESSAGAKYINTPETLVYKKGNVLYGLDRAKQAIKQAGLAVLVEGYMDCLSSHRADVRNVIAVSGTALTEQQVRLLKRYAGTIALAFDADLAGGEAARRGVDVALAADLQVRAITMPDGVKDPDELVRKDPAAWRNAIAGSERIVDYSFNRSFRDADLSDVETKKRIARQLLPVIGKLPDPIEQSHYLQQLSVRLGTDEQSLREAFRRIPQRNDRMSEKQPEQETTAIHHDRATLIAERLLAIALRPSNPVFAELLETLDPATLADSELQALYKQAVVYYSTHHAIDLDGFRRQVENELPLLRNRLAKIVMTSDEEFSASSIEELRREFDQGLIVLQRSHIAAELKQIETTLRNMERDQSGAAADALLQRMAELTTALHALDSQQTG